MGNDWKIPGWVEYLTKHNRKFLGVLAIVLCFTWYGGFVVGRSGDVLLTTPIVAQDYVCADTEQHLEPDRAKMDSYVEFLDDSSDEFVLWLAEEEGMFQAYNADEIREWYRFLGNACYE